MNWTGGHSNDAMLDAIRQGKILSFFLMKKERKLCKKNRRRGERRRGEVFDLFQRNYKLSECSCCLYLIYDGIGLDNK